MKATLSLAFPKMVPKRPRLNQGYSSKGHGFISGTIDVDGITGPGVIVELHDVTNKRFVGSTETGLVGEYIFDNIDTDRLYDVVAFDKEGLWEKQVSSSRSPIGYFNRYPRNIDLFDGEHAATELYISRYVPVEFAEDAHCSVSIPSQMYRILVMDNYNSPYVAIHELEFLDNDGNVVPAVGGNALYSSQYTAPMHVASNAFDGIKDPSISPNCWASNTDAVPAWIGYEFSDPKDISGVRIWPRSNAALPQTPSNFILQTYSGGAWHDISYFLYEPYTWVPNTAKTFRTKRVNGPKLYWGVMVTEGFSTNFIVITELEMSETPGGPNLCAGGVPAATNQYTSSGNGSSSAAFDGVKNGYQGWASANNYRGYPVLSYKFPAPVMINEVRITSVDSTDPAKRAYNFKKATIISSADGLTWQKEWDIPVQAPFGPGEERAYTRT